MASELHHHHFKKWEKLFPYIDSGNSGRSVLLPTSFNFLKVISDTATGIFESGLKLASQLSASTQSDNLSQISTWSDDMDTSLDDINSTIQTLSKGSINPLKYQLRTDYEQQKESSKRAVKRKTHTVVNAVLSCIAPGQERKLLKLIQPGESDDQETRCTDMVQLKVHLFHESSNGHTKRQLLSIICQKYTKKELQDMIPGLSTYCIDQARLHASKHGKGK
ncbi:Hypothetical predicted protein [Mytilus galloprovincialis]|uniref:Uncharacterized protein n=1 Tax=Mytilus galloprovincialis TaxID=29158 RepID=A0A8B6HNT6_MYTGA|nr:Hypothetical predicted protein [Mytilus galloprovincialis]